MEIVSDGPLMPIAKNEEGEEIPKPSSEWDESKKKKKFFKFKAMNSLFFALYKKEFHRVLGCSNA